MNAPTNPYEKDAEGAGRWIVAALRPRKRTFSPVDADTLYFVARWAGHWGNLALEHENGQLLGIALDVFVKNFPAPSEARGSINPAEAIYRIS